MRFLNHFNKLAVFFFVLGLSHFAYAESLNFSSLTSQKKYRLVPLELNAVVHHPFKTAVVSATVITGDLLADLSHFEQGVQLRVVIPAKNLEGSDRQVTRWLDKILTTREPSADIVFEAKSSQLKYTIYEEGQLVRFGLSFLDPLKVGMVSRPTEVVLDCAQEQKILKCKVKAMLSFTKYGFATPQLLGVRARDKIEVAGEISFTPEESTEF